MPNGGALIAAGAALATFGGVLAGLGSAKETGGGVATAGGGSSVSNDPVTAIPETEKQKPVTQVQVNIQGNVLDRRETGMAIMDVIREEFYGRDNQVVFA
jgi:hypothetical protein